MSDLSCKQPLIGIEPLKIGQLYRFNPNSNIPKLLIYHSPQADCRNAFVIRRRSILIVLGKDSQYYKVACSGCIGWVSLAPALLADQTVFQPIDGYRCHEDWRGNNHFFLQGRLMLGSHAMFFLAALLYIAVFSSIFFLYTGKRLDHALYVLVSTHGLLFVADLLTKWVQ